MSNEENDKKPLETESKVNDEAQEKETVTLNTVTVENGEQVQNGGRHQRKLFECDVCNMKFSNGANMRRHKMRHTGVKPYECRVCQKRFFRKDHLAEHFSTHSKTLPFHCPICARGFQRQIAMRAHFQNEHVGQHDLVKTCPLCSFRAHTMKALRVHFFNRHGVDLDNPGPATMTLLTGIDNNEAGQASESGDSADDRSTDNATPPMHYLTPHVEISMAETAYNPGRSSIQQELPTCLPNLSNETPESPQSADSNNNAATISVNQEHGAINNNEIITPSISLIPIKQETGTDDSDQKLPSLSGTSTSMDAISKVLPTLTQTVKVSPLKSLLREDLKRRISARVHSRNANRSMEIVNNSSSAAINEHEDTLNTQWMSQGSSSGLMCLFCNINFPDQTLYFLHKGCHSESNPWKCNICGEQCNNVYEFNSHLLSKSHQ